MDTPCGESRSHLAEARDWKAGCVERRTSRLEGGSWKRASNGTSLAAYPTKILEKPWRGYWHIIWQCIESTKLRSQEPHHWKLRNPDSRAIRESKGYRAEPGEARGASGGVPARRDLTQAWLLADSHRQPGWNRPCDGLALVEQ